MKFNLLTIEHSKFYWLVAFMRFGQRSLLGFYRDYPRNELDIFYFPIMWYDR